MKYGKKGVLGFWGFGVLGFWGFGDADVVGPTKRRPCAGPGRSVGEISNVIRAPLHLAGGASGSALGWRAGVVQVSSSRCQLSNR